MRVDFREFCQALVTDAADAIIYADVEGVIQFWNRGAERIFGFSELEATGRKLDIIIPANLRKRHWDGYFQTMKTGFTKYADGDVLSVPALRKNGCRISIEFTIVLFRDHDQQLCGIAAILRDVSKRYDEIKALRAAVSALQTSG